MVDDRHYFMRVMVVIILGAVYINKADACSKLSVTDASGNFNHEGTYCNLGTARSCNASGRDTFVICSQITKLSSIFTYYIYYLPSISSWVMGRSACSTMVLGRLVSTNYTPTGSWETGSSYGQSVYEGMFIRCNSSSSVSTTTVRTSTVRTSMVLDTETIGIIIGAGLGTFCLILVIICILIHPCPSKIGST